MKFMLMMSAPDGKQDYQIFNWPKAAVQAHGEFMERFNDDLRGAGEWVACVGLTAPPKARLVRARTNGTPVTDGPFPETKEFLAGFWIVDVASRERAYELAAKISTAPGADGRPLFMGVEVREVMSAPSP
jgi:hypothetical protein